MTPEEFKLLKPGDKVIIYPWTHQLKIIETMKSSDPNDAYVAIKIKINTDIADLLRKVE